MPTPADVELAAFIEAFKRAAFDKDVSGFLALYDADVCVFDLWETWSHRGVAEWKKAVENWFRSTDENRDAIGLSELSINIRGTSCWVHGIITFSCVSPEGKVLRAMHERLTWILERKDAWKIVHQHTSAPIGGRDLKIIFEKP